MKLPAIWIAREGSFGVIDEPMQGGSFVAYKNGFFEGLRFIDSSGDEWTVVTARPERNLGLLDRLLNRHLDLDIQVGLPTRPSLADVAARLCSCVDHDPDDLYDQFVSRDELKALFLRAASMHELISHARNLGATESE